MTKGNNNKIHNLNILKISILPICIIMAIIFAYMYVRNESPIYIFDYSGYFENYKLMGNLFFTNIFEFFKMLWLSIREFDYNYSSVVLLMPFYKLLGSSRFAYILLLVLIYVIPSIMLISKCFINIIYKDDKTDIKERTLYYIFTVLLVFSYTRFWSPTLRGLSDIAGVIPIICAYMMIKKRPLIEEQKLFYPIALGVVVYLPFLLRRWYVYFIISFCLTSFILDFHYFLTRSRNKETFWIAFKNYACFGLTILSAMCLCHLPLIKKILTENYSDSYSGYQVSLFKHFNGFLNEFGLIIIILIICGIILSLHRRKYVKEVIFSLLNIIFFWISFGTVQAMGVHHFLGISVWIILIVLIGIRHIFEILPRFKNFYLFVVLALFSCNFATTYIFRDKTIPIISQNNKYYKLKYYNFGELERLIHDVENLVKDTDDENDQNAKVSVLADTQVLSDNLLDLLGNVDLKDNIIYATHIDSRDGINFNSLLTQYIIVTSPSQLGTSQDGQFVIDIPNKMIYGNYGIGKAYKKISDEYLLDNGVKAYIYEKIRLFSEEEVDEYFEAFFDLYPEWKDNYTYLDKAILKANIHRGSYYGDFKRISPKTYFFFPGSKETEVLIPVSKKIKSMKLRFYVDYSGVDDESGQIDVAIITNKKIVVNDKVNYKDELIVDLDLETCDDLLFRIGKGTILKDDWLFVDIVDIEYME